MSILAYVTALIVAHGYLAIFVLMTLESASLPIPSEVVLPAVGHFIQTGALNAYIAIPIVLVSSLLGMAIDYYIAYFIGKEVVYKRLASFRIKKESLDVFDRWFNNNGSFAVFVARLIPEVRGLISFPAGFAKMPLKRFFFYSFLGAAIWDAVLIAFGYYALSTSNLVVISVAIAAFLIVLYIIYAIAMKRIKNRK